MTTKQKTGYGILIVSAIIALGLMFFIPPIPQNENYHDFSDAQKLLGVPNFRNVVSNLPFVIVGLMGLYKVQSFEKTNYPSLVFFGSIIFVGIGSAFYHLSPTSRSLVLDRLPMTLAFMALFSMVISEFIDERTGRKLLLPFLFIGILSIVYWITFNDLRFYALVQFYPMLAIPVILICFPAPGKRQYWLLLIAYVIAKLLEHFDEGIHETLKVISGHSLKHAVAAAGVSFLLSKINIKRESVS